MLIRTGTGSLSLVAGCCWVHSVAQKPAANREGKARERRINPWVDPADSRYHGQ